MGKWKYKIDLKEDHQAFDKGLISIQELSKKVAVKIKEIPCFDNDEALQEIHEYFEGLASDPECNVDDYDIILEMLYDWGDYNKICWVNTI